MAGPPRSRASRHTTAAMLAPALQPHTASCPGTPPSAAALSATHRTAAKAVVDGGGEAVLRRVAVVRPRRSTASTAHAQVAAQRIVRRGVAQHPAAAVEVHDDRVRARGRRSVEAVRQFAGRAGQHAVDDLADVGTGRASRRGLER